MKTIHKLDFYFENELEFQEISKFRGAILSIINDADIVFHNHLEDSKFRYSYPLIQYKSIDGKAVIIALQDASLYLSDLINSFNTTIKLGKRTEVLKISKFIPNIFEVKEVELLHNYKITKWLPLNEHNFEAFKNIESFSEKTVFLEKILVGNIISFAKGIKMDVDFTLKCIITDIMKQDILIHKNIRFQSMDITFKSNIALPNLIGLGKGSSHGFGVIISKH